MSGFGNEHYHELNYVDYINWHKHHKSSYRNRKEEGDNGWYGTSSLEKCYELSSKGWDAGLAMLGSDDKVIVQGLTDVMHDVYGSIVDVGRFLSGVPDSMLTFVDETNRNKPELTLYVDLGYTGGQSIEDAMRYTMYVIGKVNELQVDYDLRLVGVFCLEGSKVSNLYITIKELDERFVLNSLAFAFHPSFFRRMWHHYLNSVREISTNGGGGMLQSRTKVEKSVSTRSELQGIHQEYWLLPSLEHHKNKYIDSNITKFNRYEGGED